MWRLGMRSNTKSHVYVITILSHVTFNVHTWSCLLIYAKVRTYGMQTIIVIVWKDLTEFAKRMCFALIYKENIKMADFVKYHVSLPT